MSIPKNQLFEDVENYVRNHRPVRGLPKVMLFSLSLS
jgi:hypothetical protein